MSTTSGHRPTVAIEQRVTKGTRKSTVATITEVAQYLRLLYARIGQPHSPVTGEPLISQSETALFKRLRAILEESPSRTLNSAPPSSAGEKATINRWQTSRTRLRRPSHRRHSSCHRKL